jgi:hypothetical protein
MESKPDLNDRFRSHSVVSPQCEISDGRDIADRFISGRVSVMIVRSVAAVIVASAFAAAPASANGWSFTVTPKGEASRVIGTGMQLYGLARDLKNRAKTKQRGEGNGAAISQLGRGNSALIVQRGKDNSASIAQNGSKNAYGVFQFGRGNSTGVVQNGNGGVGLTFQGRW